MDLHNTGHNFNDTVRCAQLNSTSWFETSRAKKTILVRNACTYRSKRKEIEKIASRAVHRCANAEQQARHKLLDVTLLSDDYQLRWCGDKVRNAWGRRRRIARVGSNRSKEHIETFLSWRLKIIQQGRGHLPKHHNLLMIVKEWLKKFDKRNNPPALIHL